MNCQNVLYVLVLQDIHHISQPAFRSFQKITKLFIRPGDFGALCEWCGGLTPRSAACRHGQTLSKSPFLVAFMKKLN